MLGNTSSLFNQNPFASTTPGQAPLFGQSQPHQTSLFGGGIQPQSTGLFGATQQQQNSGLFGTQQQPTSGSLFGGSNAQTSGSLFGQPSTTAPTSPFGQTTSPFNNQSQTQSNSLFGRPQQTQSSLFGTNQTQQASSNLFNTTPAFGTQSSNIFSTPQKTGGLYGTSSSIGTAGSIFQEVTDSSVGGKIQCILINKDLSDRGKSLEQLRYEDYSQQSVTQQQALSPFGQRAPATAGSSLFGNSGTTLFGAQTQKTGSFFDSAPQAGQTQGGGLFGNNTQTGSGLMNSTTATGGLFGATTNSPSTTLFGTPSASAGGLFGNNTTNTGGLFGAKPTTTPTGGGGLFGTTSTAQTGNTGTGLFGTSGTTAGGGLFSTPNTSGGLFGNNSTGGLFGTKPPATGGGLFSTQSQQQPSGFGAQPAALANTTTTTGGLFSQPTSPSAGGGLFGTTPTGASTGTGLFGTTSATNDGGLFGNKPASGGGSLFGSSPSGTGGGLFGGTSATGGSLFGTTGTGTSTSGTGLFGGATTGAAGTGNMFGLTPSSGGLFGTSGAANTGLFGSGGGGLFGATTTPPTGGLFGNTKPNTTPTTGTESGNLFGGRSLFGTNTNASMQPTQQSPAAHINPNAPLLSSGVTDTYHLSRLAIGNAAKLIWGFNYQAPSIVKTRPSLLSDSDLASSTWKPLSRVSYIDTVAMSTRGSQRPSLTTIPPIVREREVLSSAAAQPALTARVSTTSPTSAPAEEKTARMSKTDNAPFTARHFDPLPMETDLVADVTEAPTPWIVLNTASCQTPRRPSMSRDIPYTSRSGLVSARRSPSTLKPSDLAPCLSHPEYECHPSVAALSRYSEADLMAVQDFTVTRVNYGSICWPGYTDVRGLHIDETVDIQLQAVEVYGEKWYHAQQELRGNDSEISEPPIGEGLNKEAIITLYNCKPKDLDFDLTGATPEEIHDAHKEVLMNYTEKIGAEFISLSPAWTWRFKVEHFSRYAMPVGGKATLRPLRGPSARRNGSRLTETVVKKLEKPRLGAPVSSESTQHTLVPPLRLKTITSRAPARLPPLSLTACSVVPKAVNIWTKVLAKPCNEIVKVDVQLSLSACLECSLQASSANNEFNSLFTLALAVVSTGHEAGLLSAVGTWLAFYNSRYLVEPSNVKRGDSHRRFLFVLLHLLANQAKEAADLLMSSEEHYPRLSLLLESAGLQMIPSPEILQQLESLHRLGYIGLLQIDLGRILSLLAGNVEHDILSVTPDWHFALAAILWFELSANLISAEDPSENQASHSVALGLALDNLEKEVAKCQKRHMGHGLKFSPTIFSKPAEILFLRCLIDLKAHLLTFLEEVSSKRNREVFLPILMSLISYASGVCQEGVHTIDALLRFPLSLRGARDGQILRELGVTLEAMVTSYYRSQAKCGEILLWKIIIGLLTDRSVSAIMRQVQDLTADLFQELPLELITSTRRLKEKQPAELEALDYLRSTLGFPTLFIVSALAEDALQKRIYVKAATCWMTAADLLKEPVQEDVSEDTWWKKLFGEWGADCLPDYDQCLSRALASLTENNNIYIRLRRVAALLTPRTMDDKIEPPEAIASSSEASVLWRLRRNAFDGISVRYIDEVIPYSIFQCLEALQSVVDVYRARYKLTQTGTIDSRLIAASKQPPTSKASKAIVKVVALWHTSAGDHITQIIRWLFSTIRSIAGYSLDGISTLPDTHSLSLRKFLLVEESEVLRNSPETISSIAKSATISYEQWIDQSRKLKVALNSSSSHAHAKLFAAFQNLLEVCI